ncbi:hypothetical protein GCM10017687_09800 [Streptomyces echinatus]|uniref:hypothetical protein n=1 Tax=Streptomyces echinatus TaxID=67293 RepID=UPI0031EA3239
MNEPGTGTTATPVEERLRAALAARAHLRRPGATLRPLRPPSPTGADPERTVCAVPWWRAGPGRRGGAGVSSRWRGGEPARPARPLPAPADRHTVPGPERGEPVRRPAHPEHAHPEHTRPVGGSARPTPSTPGP